MNPELLSRKDLPDSLDVGSLVRSLFSVDTGSQSWSIAASNNTDRDPRSSTSVVQQVTTDFLQAAVETDVSEEAGEDIQYSLSHDTQFFDDMETGPEFAAVESPHDSAQTVLQRAAEGEETPICDTAACARQPDQRTEKRTSAHPTQLRRTKKPRECIVYPDVDLLGTYLTEEERKCQDFGHPSPQNTFLTPVVQQAVQALDKGKTEVLAKILIYIGSPCLVGGLQDMLVSRQPEESCLAFRPEHTLSRAERVHLIASLGYAMSRSQLLRRHHVLQLFKECGRLDTSTYGIVMIPLDLAHPSNKRGNPVNRAVAEVTARMMRETFPHVKPDTDEYKSKYRWITDIRRLGQRLHILETKFGGGVLGLILDQGLAGTDVGITDKM